MTTEHFALQSARAATIAESTGRATMFLASISGGLIALGLVATASHLGTAFYAFGLVILPTLAFVGLVTFERALQTVPDLSTFRPQQRDLYVAPGRVGFWRAALRDPHGRPDHLLPDETGWRCDVTRHWSLDPGAVAAVHK